MIQTSISLQDEQYELLRKVAFEEHSSIADVIRKALDKYLGIANSSDSPPSKADIPTKGYCKNCGYFKVVLSHTFIYQYDKVTDNLCDACWKKCKQDGSARE